MRRHPNPFGAVCTIRLLGCHAHASKTRKPTNADSAVAAVCRWFFVDTSSPPVTIAFELDLETPSFVCSVEVSWVENGPDSLAEI